MDKVWMTLGYRGVRIALLVALVTAGGVLGSMLERIYLRPAQQQIVVVDTQALLEASVSKIVSESAGKDEISAQANVIGDQIENILGELSQREGLIILSSDGVIAGAHNITADVMNGLGLSQP